MQLALLIFRSNIPETNGTKPFFSEEDIPSEQQPKYRVRARRFQQAATIQNNTKKRMARRLPNSLDFFLQFAGEEVTRPSASCGVVGFLGFDI